MPGSDLPGRVDGRLVRCSCLAAESGDQLRTSDAGNCADSFTVPVRKPCASGLKGTNPMPSSSQVRSYIPCPLGARPTLKRCCCSGQP